MVGCKKTSWCICICTSSTIDFLITYNFPYILCLWVLMEFSSNINLGPDRDKKTARVEFYKDRDLWREKGNGDGSWR